MASVNLQTGKIMGCIKGSKTYYHEEGHLKYDSSPFGRTIRTMQEFSLDALIMFTALCVIRPNIPFKIIILFLIMVRIFSMFIEEQNCWAYAKRKLNEVKDVRRARRKV